MPVKGRQLQNVAAAQVLSGAIFQIKAQTGKAFRPGPVLSYQHVRRGLGSPAAASWNAWSTGCKSFSEQGKPSMSTLPAAVSSQSLPAAEATEGVGTESEPGDIAVLEQLLVLRREFISLLRSAQIPAVHVM